PSDPVTPSGPVASTAPLTPLSELPAVANPRGLSGPSSAALATNAVDAVSTPAAPVLPATVTSYERGREVTVEVTDASRVVAVDIAGTITSTVWALGQGDSLVGHDGTADFAGVEDLASVTSAGHVLNVEALVALKPTLVIADGTVGPLEAYDQLRDVGITVVFVRNDPGYQGAEDLARDVDRKSVV